MTPDTVRPQQAMLLIARILYALNGFFLLTLGVLAVIWFDAPELPSSLGQLWPDFKWSAGIVSALGLTLWAYRDPPYVFWTYPRQDLALLVSLWAVAFILLAFRSETQPMPLWPGGFKAAVMAVFVAFAGSKIMSELSPRKVPAIAPQP